MGKHAALTIQACWRSYRVRRALERTQAAVYLQAAWRGYLQRQAYHHQRHSIIRLQSLCRGHLQRRSFSQMVSEKQKAEQAREAAGGKLSEGEPGPVAAGEQLSEHPVEDPESLGVEAETWMNKSPDGMSPKKETPSPEMETAAQKTVPAESHEKVSSSREKRESRRQRGLEHVERQNKHIQSCREESSTHREPSRRASLEIGESFPEGTKGPREDGLEAWTETTAPSSSKQAQVVGDPPGSPSPVQRPTTLALDSRVSPMLPSSSLEVSPVLPSSSLESPKDKDKDESSTKAQDKPESPSGSTQIQRYQHPDTERLATAVEIWRGKKLASAVLSQSLDLSEKHRATGAALTPTEKSELGAEPGHFGVCVDSLTSDKASVPIVLEKLLEHVEMHGLYTEGLYRKSGAANRTRELRQALQTDPAAVKLEDFPIHAITGVLKQWLRELPEPLMTFAQYGDFLRAVELPEKQEQLSAIYAVLDHLPEANHTSLERLIFHLVKVALLEDVNRMSPGALAIIFAPCLLRCPDNSDPLTSMKDVLKITTCVEMLIKEQMRKYKMKMEEINHLEAAESIAFRRLSLLRQNAIKSPRTPVVQDLELGALPEEAAGGDEDREKEILMERIQSIKEEKEANG